VAKGVGGGSELAQEIVSETEVIVRRHVLGIESRGTAQIGARSCKLPQREFAMAALGVEVGILRRNRQSASQGFDRFPVLPDGDLRLRQFEQQVGVLGVGGEVLLRACDCALFVGQRIELRAEFGSDFESGLSGRGSRKRKHRGQETERTHGDHSCEDYSGLDRRFRSIAQTPSRPARAPKTGSRLSGNRTPGPPRPIAR
jgi:hypothetical protein